MKKLISGIFILFLMATVGYCQEQTQTFQTVTVVKVIDGDTLKLSSGEIVRLLGIDCAEDAYTPAEAEYLNVGKKWKRGPDSLKQAKQARGFVKNVVEGKKVFLEFDVQKKDKYGRLLAYVWYEYPDEKSPLPYMEMQTIEINGVKRGITLLNVLIIGKGYASVMTIAPNVKYADLFQQLYLEARENKRGFWARE